MTVKRVWMALVLGAAVAACQKDTSGAKVNLPPLAGLRYFDAVLDTTYMDFRVVDIVSYAPNSIRARFRTGGDPGGVSNTTFSPPFLPVQTGAHDIRVFLDSSCTAPCAADLATNTTVMFDTTITFSPGWNYTFVLYGSARAKTLHAMILADTTIAPPDANSSIWVRTLNLASDATGAQGDTTGIGTSGDVFVIPQANTQAGAPTIGGSLYKAKSAYVRVATGSLKAVVTRTGDATLTTVATLNFLDGVVGTAAVNPVPGALVKNTAFTVVILPRSKPGAGVPFSYATPGVFILTDQIPPLTAP